MPALFFPNLDTLRLALVSGLVPPEVARAPGAGRVRRPRAPLARTGRAAGP
ncbi:hypothetical protein [Frigoriglobus tundricola]|uniref:FtsH ternary system domain-containing protein n=1 Tax=Frigoriglobus tundricola TaxID=2774151 RepID=A0A6M5YYV3_9BACT|nr:hypothetical protein FTUN_6923 [Frigoriglobus tundricola]